MVLLLVIKLWLSPCVNLTIKDLTRGTRAPTTKAKAFALLYAYSGAYWGYNVLTWLINTATRCDLLLRARAHAAQAKAFTPFLAYSGRLLVLQRANFYHRHSYAVRFVVEITEIQNFLFRFTRNFEEKHRIFEHQLRVPVPL